MYYKDLDLVQKAERLRGQGFIVFVGGSVHCPEDGCESSVPLDDPEVEGTYYAHAKDCPRRKQIDTVVDTQRMKNDGKVHQPKL